MPTNTPDSYRDTVVPAFVAPCLSAILSCVHIRSLSQGICCSPGQTRTADPYIISVVL